MPWLKVDLQLPYPGFSFWVQDTVVSSTRSHMPLTIPMHFSHNVRGIQVETEKDGQTFGEVILLPVLALESLRVHYAFEQ